MNGIALPPATAFYAEFVATIHVNGTDVANDSAVGHRVNKVSSSI